MFTFTGFRDGHSHPLFASREAEGPSVDSATTPAEVCALVAAYLADNPETAWLDCGSYSPAVEALGISRHLLDTVSNTVPIVVHAVDHHSIWVNSAALQVAGFQDSAPKLPHASFDLDSDGVPTGIVREWDAMSLIYAHQPPASLELDLAALGRAQERMLSHGIVAVQDAWIDPGMEAAYLSAAASDTLRLRFNLATRIDPATWRERLSFAKGLRSDARAIGNALLTANTVKIFIDGVFNSETAWTSHEYCSGKSANGIWDEQELPEMALQVDSAGFQLHFHCVGDAAFAQALRAVEHLEMCNGPTDRRPVIAHADLVDTESLRLAARSGVVICAQPAWATDGPDLADAKARIGDQATGLYPLRAMADAGICLSFGSDWPVSAPNPLLGLIGATLGHHNPQQALSRREAIGAYSLGTAWQLGQELTATEDEVTLDTDISTCTPDQLANASVLKVKVAGRQVWQADH